MVCLTLYHKAVPSGSLSLVSRSHSPLPLHGEGGGEGKGGEGGGRAKPNNIYITVESVEWISGCLW